MKPSRMPWLWALVVGLLLLHNGYLWLGQRMAPDTDILALLPVQERDPILQKSFSHMVDAAQQRVVVLIGAPDWQVAKDAAGAYRQQLQQAGNPAILQISNLNEQTQTDWLQSFQRHRNVLMASGQEAQLRQQSPQYWLETAQRALYSPFGGPKLGSWRDDPFGLFAAWVQERAQETPVRPRDGWLYVSAQNMHYVLLPLTLSQPAFSLVAQQQAIPLLAKARAAALKSANGVEVITAGVVLHAAHAGEQAGNEVSTIGIGSLAGIVLLMWFSFRSFKPIVLVLLSIGIGCLGAMSVCSLLFDRIHIMTLVFSASLIGVAQDYGLYFLCSRLHADARLPSRTLLRQILPGLVLTLITTVIGYMGLAMTPFPGLRQMALFSALGLVFAWLTVVFWFPGMVAGGSLKSGALVGINHRLLLRWPLLRLNPGSALALILFAIISAIGCARLGVNDDIRLLQNSPKYLIDDQIKLSRILDAPTPVQFFLLRAPSSEALLQREEQLKAQLAPLIAQGRLGGVQAISNWVPSLATQNARRALLNDKLLNDGGPLAQLAQQLEESPDWVATTRSDLLSNAQPLLVDGFLRSPASEPWRHLWLGQSGKADFASIIALRGLQRASLPELQQIATRVPGVQWVDKVGEISSVLGRYRQNMGWVVLASYALVYVLMLPRYGRATWRALLPTALASVATLAILGYSGQALQLFHILALMLLLGVGVDYGIFIQEHPNRREAAPWLTIGLSASNTILSFGLLGLSHTPALQAFGLTMLLGTALVWLIAPMFGNGDAAANDAIYDSEFDATNDVANRFANSLANRRKPR